MIKNTSSGRTPEKVTELLKKAVAEKSQSAVARESGIALFSVQRYLKGVGVPTPETLKKLADYFQVKVRDLIEDVYFFGEDSKEEITADLEAQKNNLYKVVKNVRSNDLKDMVYRLRKIIVSDIRLNPQRTKEESEKKIIGLATDIIKRIIGREYHGANYRKLSD
jgi:transcriptional regulator with XRE-family HTH domain